MVEMKPRRGYADGPFGQVHYQALGEGPPVLLLHQAPMTSGQFDNVYQPLADRGFFVVGVDMPGFGMSDPTPGVPRVEDYAKAAPAVIHALGLGPAAVVGHHTGALVATEVALQFPELVSCVVLNGPMPLSSAERDAFLDGMTAPEKAFKALPGGAHFSDLFKIRESMASGSVPLERLSDYVVQALVGRGAYWYGHHAAFTYDHEQGLRAMAHRALILTNTGDQIYAHAQRARAIRPDFDYVELEGGGIDIVDQAPKAWAEAVATFLVSVKAGS